MMKKQLISIILLLTASSFSCFAANETKLDAKTQQQVVEKVKEYCTLMQDVSGDVEKIDKMETIYGMCENSNVSVFNDLTVPSARDISVNSMPLQQYMMMLTDKYEHNVKTSYSGYKYVKTIVQPSPLEGFDATSYAFVKVNKQVNTGSYKAKMNLNVIVNTETKKVSSTISEDYEDPQSIYLEALEKFNDKDYKAAIQLFNKVCNLQRFSGRNRAKSMLGWIYAEQREWKKAYDLLRESSAEDPLGAIILASNILINDDAPAYLRNFTEAGIILRKLGDTRDKDFPTMHLIAKSAMANSFDFTSFSAKLKLSGKEMEQIANDLINDPATTDVFRMIGYYLKAMEFVSDKKNQDLQKAEFYIKESEKMLQNAHMERLQFEKWDANLSLLHLGIMKSKGDDMGALALAQVIINDKPYAAGELGTSLVIENDFKQAMKFYRKAADYGDSFACYIVALSYKHFNDPPSFPERIYLRQQLISKDDVIKTWTDFVFYLMTDEELQRNDTEFLKWINKAIDLGSIDAREDYAFFEAAGMLPGGNRNIAHAVELACEAVNVGLRSRTDKYVHTCVMSYRYEMEQNIPFVQSETYKTLKKLDEKGNGAASFSLSGCFEAFANDSIQAMHYLERSKDAHFYQGMYDYANIMMDKGNYDVAFNTFKELTFFPYSMAYCQLGDIEKNYRHNYKEALKYYNQGRKEKEPFSYEGLSDLFKDGLGVQRDLRYARNLIDLAIGNYKFFYRLFSADEVVDDDKNVQRMNKKMAELDSLIAAEGVATPQTETLKLNEILDKSISEDERITKSETLLAEMFATPKAVVKTVGSNGKTVVSTETAEDFLLRLATMPADKKLVEVSSKKDKNGKYTELTVKIE